MGVYGRWEEVTRCVDVVKGCSVGLAGCGSWLKSQ